MMQLALSTLVREPLDRPCTRAEKERFAMITDEEKTLIRDNFRSLVPHVERVSDLFFQRLNAALPHAQEQLSLERSQQRAVFRSLLSFVMKAIDHKSSAWRETPREEDDLFVVALALGRMKPRFDASEQAVGAALLWALDYALGTKFDAAARAAWTRLYALIATAIRMGKHSAPGRLENDLVLARVVSLCAQLEPGGVS
jgi:hypothetical protein